MVPRPLQKLSGDSPLVSTSRLDLEGLFYICVLQLYSLVDQFRLGGSRRGFSPSTSVSSSITCHSVILCLHLSSLLFKLLYLLLLACGYGLESCFSYCVSFTLVPHLHKLK